MNDRKNWFSGSNKFRFAKGIRKETTMPVKNLKDLYNKANTGNAVQVTMNRTSTNSHGSAGSLSFGIVNSVKNGKRLSLSGALARRLGVTDTAYIVLLPSDHVVLIAKQLPLESAMQMTLKSEKRCASKICYSYPLVKAITDSYNLDFTGRTSMTFYDIDIINEDGTDVAVITINISSSSDTIIPEDES